MIGVEESRFTPQLRCVPGTLCLMIGWGMGEGGRMGGVVGWVGDGGIRGVGVGVGVGGIPDPQQGFCGFSTQENYFDYSTL